jgi:twinkle protein
VKRPNQREAAGYHRQLFNDAKFAHVLAYLTGKENDTQRHLTAAVLRKYRVGAAVYKFLGEKRDGEARPQWVDHTCVTFPWILKDEERDDAKLYYARLKVRSLDDKSCMRLDPAGGAWGLFGWHTVPDDATEVVLTEGEYDAMAVHQATKLPAVSLPNGASSLPVGVLPLLERFERIYVWMDDDVAGQEGARKFATKLGLSRCLLVSTRRGNPAGPKDANDALRRGADLKAMLADARPVPHKQIMQFDDLRSAVQREFANPVQVAGRQSLMLPRLNGILRGHRPGELSIYTGPTGMGKTTLLTQLSLDFAMQGVNTLWGSFELSNVRLVKKMLHQFAGVDFADPAHLDQFDYHADRFRALPLYFLRFWGSTDVDQIIDAMAYAVYVYDVEHIVLDNLQFMTGRRASGMDRFQVLDDAIERFRRFASEQETHISLVIHPRKQAEHVSLHMSDVFGSAKAIQEADNVIILQSSGEHRTLEVKKNRFDGTLGSVPLLFNRATQRFDEVSTESNVAAAKQTSSSTSSAPAKQTFIF